MQIRRRMCFRDRPSGPARKRNKRRFRLPLASVPPPVERRSAGADPPTPPFAPNEPRPAPVLSSRLGPETHVTHDAVGASCPVSLGYATDTSPAARRSTRLLQYGGPRAGARRGASVDSPRPRRKRRTDAASVTSATRRMRPPQRGHARTSIAKQRLRSSAQGRYRDPACFAGFSASAVPSAATAGRGTTLRPHLARRCEDPRVTHGMPPRRRHGRGQA